MYHRGYPCSVSPQHANLFRVQIQSTNVFMFSSRTHPTYVLVTITFEPMYLVLHCRHIDPLARRRNLAPPHDVEIRISGNYRQDDIAALAKACTRELVSRYYPERRNGSRCPMKKQANGWKTQVKNVPPTRHQWAATR
jgi:hypothetical protein